MFAQKNYGGLWNTHHQGHCAKNPTTRLFLLHPIPFKETAASFQCLQLITQEIHQESCSLSRSRPASSTSLIKLLVSGMSSWSSPHKWQLLVAKVNLYRLNGNTLWNAPAKSSYLQQSETKWCAGIPSIQIAYDIYAYVYACNDIQLHSVAFVFPWELVAGRPASILKVDRNPASGVYFGGASGVYSCEMYADHCPLIQMAILPNTLGVLSCSQKTQ